jgi:hypothetical protein
MLLWKNGNPYGRVVNAPFRRHLTGLSCETVYKKQDIKFEEIFEKCQFLFEFKEGENFNHRHTLSISRIKI